MEVPEKSVITDAYWEASYGLEVHENTENLNWWKHSQGILPDVNIKVEATRVGKRVFALITPSN